MRPRHRSAPVIIAALLLAGCTTGTGDPSGSTSSAPTVRATPSPPSSEEPEPSASAAPSFEGHPAAGLALVQSPNPNDPASQVFVVEADGSLRQVTGLAAGATGASGPAWSPDGMQLAFNAPKVGAPVPPPIGIVNADGSEERSVALGANPQWSPDGTRILFSEVDDVTSDPVSMYVYDVASGETTDLGRGFEPQWVTDDRIGFRMVLETDDGSFSDALHTMALDARVVDPFGTEPGTQAVWSPDGSMVLIIENEAAISVANADGSDARVLAGGYAPLWSPDMSRVLLAYDVDEQAIPVLALVDLDGTRIWSGAIGQAPAWSADGTRIAVEIPVPEPMITILDAATGEVLFEIEGSEPAWQP